MKNLSRWALVLCLVPTFGIPKALSRESTECSPDIATNQNVCEPVQSNGATRNDKGRPAENLPSPSFLPPPPSIADITAILDSEKPDPATLARMRFAADAEPASN